MKTIIYKNPKMVIGKDGKLVPSPIIINKIEDDLVGMGKGLDLKINSSFQVYDNPTEFYFRNKDGQIASAGYFWILANPIQLGGFTFPILKATTQFIAGSSNQSATINAEGFIENENLINDENAAMEQGFQSALEDINSTELQPIMATNRSVMDTEDPPFVWNKKNVIIASLLIGTLAFGLYYGLKSSFTTAK